MMTDRLGQVTLTKYVIQGGRCGQTMMSLDNLDCLGLTQNNILQYYCNITYNC